MNEYKKYINTEICIKEIKNTKQRDNFKWKNFRERSLFETNLREICKFPMNKL